MLGLTRESQNMKSNVFPSIPRRKTIESTRCPLLRRFKLFPVLMTCILGFLLYSDFVLANAYPSAKPRSYFVKTKSSHLHVRRCSILSNEPLHRVMEGVCDHCHAMFSHIEPDMRIKCRTKCFKSEAFKTCLNIFSRGSSLLPHASEQLLSHLGSQRK